MTFPEDQLFTAEIWFVRSFQRQYSDDKMIHKIKDLDLRSEEYIHNLNVTLPVQAMNNGTFFARVDLYPNGQREHTVSHGGKMISHQVPVRYINLLGDGEDLIESGFETTSHLRSKLEFNVITEKLAFPKRKVPGEIRYLMRFDKDKIHYKPIVYVSELNFRTDELKEIEKDKNEMELTIRYRPVGVGKFRFMSNMERSLLGFQDMGFQEKDVDDVKGLIVDTEMYILLLTFTVSAFHLLFDALAFKNDVSYWRKRESMAGISIRSVAFQTFSTLIIFVHLLHTDTSLLVSGPMGVSVFIEAWKLIKAIGLRKRDMDKGSETEEYDKEIMKKLSYVLVPLCVGGAIYSLFYVPHKSWYGWALESLVNGVYAFGFLFMLPQLFINYKMKSVAHLPWKAFMYKAFNTFIDDVFAFIIKMPTTHRIACFRDDIVFFCYLYQRYLYPVDKSRVNEFGFSAEDEEKEKNEENTDSEKESENESIGSAGDAKTIEQKKDE